MLEQMASRILILMIFMSNQIALEEIWIREIKKRPPWATTWDRQRLAGNIE